ncbi:C39 family peptidase [Alkalihalobacillus sp. LMS39]|uniref:C39 family peptidase n=1 Tax=Alkalihalobacillus sp. LMS39 TaxID=2924032 RepID=UPI001FB1AC50|nr:C39 family peptidase [Alkalihalobacillus sp. LMS39]UOE94048.1 C39 family peptidase [Alkalihalobacillus sp. LMS39]
MKKIVTVLMLLLLLVVAVGMFNQEVLQNSRDYMKDHSVFEAASQLIKKTKQGTITIENVDVMQEPVRAAEYVVVNESTDEEVALIVTDDNGIGTSKPIPFGKTYQVIQRSVAHPYQLHDEEVIIDLEEDYELKIENELLDYVKDVQYTDGSVEITESHIPVATLMQNPELPNGCEIVSLTAVLNYYGYDVSKTTMADDFLPKQPFARQNNKLYGANPYEAYAGEPRDRSGFFVYAPPILQAAEDFMSTVESSHKAVDVSGSTREELLEYLKQGIPVVTWMTLELDAPRVTYSWYFHETEEFFEAPVNLHATVLNGFIGEDKVHVMDPLKGQMVYSAENYFTSYDALGSHAMILVEDE